MKKRTISLAIIVFFAMGILLILGISREGTREPNVAEKTIPMHESLSIALVNEDQGVRVDNTDYNLGQSYIRNIERDEEHDWYVVSRGVAESGLQEGNYQLILSIPSNFSEMVLNLDESNPQQLQLNYRINAGEDGELEARAREVGDQIVRELNQQLIDIYVATILDNLHTAQTNVLGMVRGHSDNVDAYANSVYTPAVNFTENIPGFISISSSALNANEQLSDGLESFRTNAIDGLIESQLGFSTSLEDLMDMRTQGQLTYEGFQAALLEMEQDLLNQQTDALYQELQFRTEELTNELLNQNLSGNFLTTKEELDQQINQTLNQLDQIEAEINRRAVEISEEYNPVLYDYFGVNDSETITLRELLDTAFPTRSGRPSWRYSQQIDNSILAINQDREDQRDVLTEQASQLPFHNDRSLYTFIEESPHHFSLNSLAEYIERTNILERLEESEFSIHSESQAREDLEAAASNLRRAIRNFDNEERTLTITDLDGYGEGRLSLEAPEGIEITSVLLNRRRWFPGEELDITNLEHIQVSELQRLDINYIGSLSEESSGNIYVFYLQEEQIEAEIPESDPDPEPDPDPEDEEELEEDPEEDEDSSENDSESEIIETEEVITTFNGQNFLQTKWSFVPEDLNSVAEYREAVENYQRALTSTEIRYREASIRLSLFENVDQNAYDRLSVLLDSELSDTLEHLVGDLMSGELRRQRTELEALKEQGNLVEEQNNELNDGLQQIQQTNEELQNDVQNQLAQLEVWREQLVVLLQEEGQVSSLNLESDNFLETNVTVVSSLIDQSETVRDLSEQNVEAASSIYDVFEEFDTHVQQAQVNSESLSSEAERVLTNFENELASNEDFAEEFATIMSNAQQDGVINEPFMQFLSQPISGGADMVLQTSQTQRAFVWVIILFTMGLLLAQLVQNQNVFAYITDAFQDRPTQWSINAYTTIGLAITSLIFGAVISFLTLGDISGSGSDALNWVVAVIAVLLISTLLNHYLLKQFRTAGFTITILLFVSYILVSGIAGTIGRSVSLTNFIRNIHPLTLFERMLNTFFTDSSIGQGVIFLFAILILGTFLLNIFIWRKKETNKDQDVKDS